MKAVVALLRYHHRIYCRLHKKSFKKNPQISEKLQDSTNSDQLMCCKYQAHGFLNSMLLQQLGRRREAKSSNLFTYQLISFC